MSSFATPSTSEPPVPSVGPAGAYAPAGPDDPFMPAYVALQGEALCRIAGRLAERLPVEERRSAGLALGLFRQLPESERRAILTHPLYQYWWGQLCRRYRAGQLLASRQWLLRLPAFIALPSLRNDLLPPEGFSIPVDGGMLRFPAEDLRIYLGDTDAGTARLTQEGEQIYVSCGGRSQVLYRAALIDRQATAPALWRPKTVGPAAIPVDGTDIWMHTFLHDLNKTETSPGHAPSVLRATDLGPSQYERLDGELRRLRKIWPDMADEIGTNVRLFSPIVSETMEAFTNTGWQGGIFLRSDFEIDWFLLERLVHESSHLRLNLIMASAMLHTAPLDMRLPSPFRAGPRPINGLYHGAFVVTRSAEALARHFMAGGDETVRIRVAVLREKVEKSFEILDRDVPLTDFGQRLLAETREALAALPV